MRVASCLNKNGFRKGDTLIYISDQPVKVYAFLLGTWRANGILRAGYVEDYGPSLLEEIQESQAKWILCDSDIAQSVLETRKMVTWNVRVIAFGLCSEDCMSVDTFFQDDGKSTIS